MEIKGKDIKAGETIVLKGTYDDDRDFAVFQAKRDISREDLERVVGLYDLDRDCRVGKTLVDHAADLGLVHLPVRMATATYTWDSGREEAEIEIED